MWLTALPMVFAARRQDDVDQTLNVALASASAALAGDTERRDSRSRICFLLAELAVQFGRRTADQTAPIPVSRTQLARAAGTTLTRVKRIVAFLGLSRVIEQTPDGIRITDWERLCSLACYDRSWTGIPEPEESELLEIITQQPELPEPRASTRAGDPASFV